MSEKRNYVRTEDGDHRYLIRERLGGKRAGVFGVVIRRYDGQGRYGAEYSWVATCYADGARTSRSTLGSAAAWLGARDAVPAEPQVSGTRPDTAVQSLRGIAASGGCVWVHSAGVWCVLGPADKVVPGATVTVRTARGDTKQVMIRGEIETCTVDGHSLAWAADHRALGDRTNTRSRDRWEPRRLAYGAFRGWECPGCGEELEDHVSSCWECGYLRSGA